MAISKKVKLNNGINLSYHVINSIKVNKDNIEIILDSFMSKKYYDLGIKRYNLLKEQKELEKRFNELYLIELNEEQEKELDIVAKKINDLADKINQCEDYNKFILAKQTITIPAIEDFSIDNIEKQLLTIEDFKDAEIVK